MAYIIHISIIKIRQRCKGSTLSRGTFLPHGVEHLVAFLSLVLLRETDDRQLSATCILCVDFQSSIYVKILLF